MVRAGLQRLPLRQSAGELSQNDSANLPTQPKTKDLLHKSIPKERRAETPAVISSKEEQKVTGSQDDTGFGAEKEQVRDTGVLRCAQNDVNSCRGSKKSKDVGIADSCKPLRN